MRAVKTGVSELGFYRRFVGAWGRFPEVLAEWDTEASLRELDAAASEIADGAGIDVLVRYFDEAKVVVRHRGQRGSGLYERDETGMVKGKEPGLSK